MTTGRPQRWDEEADVLVVGYGGAGVAAAITAHDAGVKVLLLEKQPADTPRETRHTPSSRMTGGAWLSPLDVGAAIQYMEKMVTAANETLDEERKAIVRTLAENLAQNRPWMEKLGVEWARTGQELSPVLGPAIIQNIGIGEEGKIILPEYPEFPGAQSMVTYFPKTSGLYRDGAAIFKALSENVSKRRIPVLWEAPARELVVESGEVRGVIAERAGKRLAVRANRGVVLTSGGFEFNEWMKENYLRAYPAPFYGNPGNTGDGINMALRAGAALWHMNCISWRCVMKFDRFAFSLNPMALPSGEIFVDKRGKRFASETYRTHVFGYDLVVFDSAGLSYPRIPFYYIFDEKRRRSGPLPMALGPGNPPGGVMGPAYYVWSQDNQAEIEKGWILKASTIAELAQKIAKDPASGGLMSVPVLEESVKTYNRYCQRGEDPEFHRPKATLIPLADSPFYAVRLWPGGPNTQGGPMRNVRCQVLHPDKIPLPRLYSAGELGSFWSMLAQGGGATGECYAMGRIAGANAAAEKRLD